MTFLKIAAFALLALIVAAAVLAVWVNGRDRAQARVVWEALEAERPADPPVYDPVMIEGLPEIAQRYFARAITPGTPLHRTVRLEMEGSFIMNGNPLPMTAWQILAPPGRGFVWRAEIGSGLMRFAGSDGYHAPEGQPVVSWTKFWLHGLVPLARIGETEDHARAAATRVMMESVWAPASLLPQFGADWTQTGSDTAEIRFADAPDLAPMQVTLDAEGNLITVEALRWSDANPERRYRLQPFGGHVREMGRHQGFLVPTQVEMGNLFGTTDYAPFFIATVTRVVFQ